MAAGVEARESELVESVCARVRERSQAQPSTECEAFVRQYFHWIPPDDLDERGVDDLSGAALAHWRLMLRRRGGEAKVRVYNPDRQTDGWSSPHTVVEVVSDDMPFVVDSVTMELGRQGYGIDLVIHPVMRVRRDRRGRLVEVLDPKSARPDAVAESILHAEVRREPDAEARAALGAGVQRVLDEVRRAVEDWGAMCTKLEEIARELSSTPPPIGAEEVEEAIAMLRWLAEDRFTFLGYREYELVSDEARTGLLVVDGTGLGILRARPRRRFTPLAAKAVALARSPSPLVITKANSRSTVHRPAYLDYIGVKRFSPEGEVVGERRFLGLFTHVAYRESPWRIPLLRGKVSAVVKRAGFPAAGHDAKALAEILESYPRDSLFQMDADELFEVAIGILGAGERERLRLFVRRDPLERFMACMVLIPRDRFNTQTRERVGKILTEAFGGQQFDWSLQRSESRLVRVHYIVRCPHGLPDRFDSRELERRLARAIRAWGDDLRAALLDALGEDRGAQLHRRYEPGFPPAYRDDWPAALAVSDIARLEQLTREGGPIIELYRRPEDVPAGRGGQRPGEARCKLFSAERVALSDVLPTFEHMGARVVDERPYELRPVGCQPLFIYDFGLQGKVDRLDLVKQSFEEAFIGVWRGEFEDDRLNGLVLEAGLTGRQITILRATARYLRQAGIAFSDAYMERTLRSHPDIARLLVELFEARFDPGAHDAERAQRIGREVEQAVDPIPSLDEDRILRSFLTVIRAIVRTNCFRTQGPGPAQGIGPAPASGGTAVSGAQRPFLSFKLDPDRIPLLPRPRPRFEIFVYAPRVEGVHLRGGKVARGGVRWSDRLEDFRTEILGLMKAQMVKNALIVPVGSKGGFVVKRPPPPDPAGGREALQKEAIACYRMFLSGLLDLTDNIEDGRIVPPPQVVRYDDDDPYLVVAADKGTASFSDIANRVSADYGFWLSDAFASGGSTGYDHKAMGITARGAWEAVKRHFRQLGTDIQTSDFTVVGIGDMSGDVFGNGMLLSRHIKLLAAFNHQHVFLDPDPDPATSYRERRRLFELPQSSWSDYDRSLISEGGGVFPRSAKSIPVSPPLAEALAIEAGERPPAELICAILRAPVDLLWNGGIGTYVKASDETHADAGDKSNDALRVNGSAVRCRVVGEGGNLGFTQRGRIEYALRGGPDGEGGRINTDAIDNVAGVNTSDHEVNIKILLGSRVSAGQMTQMQRNQLLAEMTDAVAERVLYASYTQTQAISLALAQAPPMIDVHARLIRQLEQVAGLDRALEFLPSEETISERKAEHVGLVAPELAVLMAYCKIHLYAQLLDSDLPEDPYLGQDLERYFPSPLPARYPEQMRGHRLRREIVATVVANQLVDRAGITFAFRLGEETGASPPLLARGYAVAREVFEMHSFWEAVESLDDLVGAHTQLDMLIEGRKLLERASRWLVRANPNGIEIEATAERFRDCVTMLREALPEVLDGTDRDAFDGRVAELGQAGVPGKLARMVAEMPHLLVVFDIVEIARRTARPPRTVTQTYFRLGSEIGLTWLRDRILELPRANRWQALSRAALRDDLYSLHRALSEEVLEDAPPGAGAQDAIGHWRERNRSAVQRSRAMIDDIRASRIHDTTTLPVALREVRNLISETRAAGPGAAPTQPIKTTRL